MKFLATVFLLLFSLMNVSAQKSPYHIRNYKPTEYGGYMQTWQVLQDKRGLIFLASTSKIHTYDGHVWEHIPVIAGAATRQVFYDSLADVVYVGSVGNFGCLERDSTGRFFYRSFMDQLKPEEAVFTDVWKIQQQGSKIYFQSAEHIFIVENKKVTGRIDPAQGSTFALMFNCAGRIFVRQRGVGLMEISGNTMTLVPGSEMFATTRLMGMLPMDKNNFYLLTGDQGFVHMRNAAAQPAFEFFPVKNDTFLVQNNVLGVEWINANEFCVSSRYGMMIYNRDFTPKVLFNKASGLNDESISEFFVDREKNIWLAHNQGCTMISYSSPFLFYEEDYGFDGTLETMAVSSDTLYIGSSTGLFRATGINDGPPHFTRMPAVPNETWDIMLSGSSVFASSSTGLYEINGEASVQLSNRYTNGSVWLDTNRTLVAAEKGGFSVFSTNEKREWKEERHFELPGMEFTRFCSPEPTGKPNEFRFFATTRFKSIAIVDFNYKDSALHVRELLPVNGLPVNDYFPTKYNDTIYFLGYRTACRYIPERDKNDSSVCVAPATDIFDRIFADGDAKHITRHIDYRLFLESSWRSRSTSFFGLNGNEVVLKPIMLGSVFHFTGIQSGCVQMPDAVWILSQQSMIRFDLNYVRDTASPYSALITHVHFAGDSLEYLYPDHQMEVKYAQNSVAFRFAAPYFKYDKSSVYQFMLIGYDTGWSEPTLKPEKEYTNLPEGTYTFVVRAENLYNVKSEEARFTFTILPPWYRTFWAYTVYAIAFILFVFAAVRLGARRLRRQKEKLELVVKERTAEVVEQKQQIEKQKVDLEEAYTGIQDSIQYSQRIQNAILPTSEEIKRIVPESFVLFFPRDIVSGDFYWFAEKNGLKFIACVDCTGHGVPGALMSMIGNTILNQIILERNISEPDQILNNLHVGVRHALKQDAGGDTRDGMDLSLIVIDEERQLLHYAGANRNLWLIRNGALAETKADKFPIAGSQQEETRGFTAHAIPLQKGDVIYLTTDGYADQFGGPKGKKFMVKQLSRILLEIHPQPMSEQKIILDEKFKTWKGSHEQVDDVLVIGLRI